ncbi:hypothetical protein MBANPS3_009269 [Mucor bainieri]
MGAQVVDYRVSTLVVLCKDCGHDVGLYPARHKCQPVERPAMPALPAQYTKEKKLNIPGSLELSARTISSGSSSSMASSPSPSFSSAETPTSKWSSRLQNNSNNKADDDNEESVYFNNFAANLPETNEASGKKLWGKVRQNEKWKQLSEKNEKPKQSGKLWGKLIQATQNMADKIPARDDRGAESDEDDWEGETHVSRILREHYEKKRMRLPDWLFDENVPVSRKSSSSNRRDHDQRSPVHQQQQQLAADGPMRTPSRRRLWEQSPQDGKNMSSRERERQELRQAQPPMPPPSAGSENRSRYSNRDHYYNEDRDNSSSHSSGGRYSNHEDDRYSSSRHYEQDHDRRNQPTREDDRYYDDRYKSSHNARRDDYGQGRDRYDTSPPPQTRGSRDQPRYYDDDHRYQQPQPTSQRPLSPLQKQQPNSTSRPRYHEEDRGGYYDTAPVKSERSTRGYGDRSNRYDQGPPVAAEYDDYYDTRRVPAQSRDRVARYQDHIPSEMSRREPSIRSGGRRYGNDPSYF